MEAVPRIKEIKRSNAVVQVFYALYHSTLYSILRKHI